MKVREVMNRAFISLINETNLSEAAAVMLNRSLEIVVVVDNKECLVGAITKESILETVRSQTNPNSPISECLAKNVKSLNSEVDLDEIDVLSEDHFIVTETGKVLGVFSKPRIDNLFNAKSPKASLEFNTFLDFIHNPVVGIDSLGKVIIWNRSAEKTFRRSRKEIMGQPITNVVRDSPLINVAQTGKHELIKTLKVNGKSYMVNRTPVTVGGNVVGAVSLLQDISELEAISNELKQTQEITKKLDAIIESSFDGIVVTDGSGRINIMNKSYERITGVKRKEVLGKKMDSLVKQGYYNESVTLLILESKRPKTIIQKVKTGKSVIITGTPLFDDNGDISLIVVNVRDNTELANLQEELEKMEMLEAQHRTKLQQLGETVGAGENVIIVSKKMEELQELIVRTAGVDSTVLLLGESGVGKEVFAELIYTNSKRRENKFVKINCAAIPEHLLESELFGYVAGSFTGAKKEGKIGLLEAADGGTIFLDEIGDMPMNVQSKILRVLQEKEVLRIGDVTPKKIDVRIISATNRVLDNLVKRRLFRRDLFYRINVIPITIPPLRERKESIINFSYHFLKKYNLKYGLNKQIDTKVIDELIAYDWPGNVRELQNVVERLVVTSSGEVITENNLPRHFKIFKDITERVVTENKTLYTVLDEVECNMLTQALRQYKTTPKIGKALGINQSTVVRKLKKHGMRTSITRK